MLFTVVSTILAFSVMAVLVSPNAPVWLQWMSWGYVLVWIAIGQFAINADKVWKCADRKEAELRARLKR
ncbi:hypothetical protein LRP49_15390 [Enterovibrio sp. ZSDZ35]|uniref:2TM domain-containing protein n=1 Tax=Enterovibrio qingdaonensis TaxID=2899818 RepID=A0ABT5QNJ7_9GAMM|nr:hypothetical protein [Enterovibrio sp. ZSDZ35]MDD1782555.1 hypothetical protein [Enterovibrio sp. ZSDZ35]